MCAVRFKKTMEPMLDWAKVRNSLKNMSSKKIRRFGRSPTRSRNTSRGSSASSNGGDRDRPPSKATSPNAAARSNGDTFFANGSDQKQKKQKQSTAKHPNAKNTSSASTIAKKPSALPSLLDARRNSSAPVLVLPEHVPDEDGRRLSIMSDSGALEEPSPQQTFDFSSLRSSLRSSLGSQASQSNESNGLLVPPPRVPSLSLGPRRSNPDIGAGVVVEPETRPRNEEWTGAANEESEKRKLLAKRLSLQTLHLRSTVPISPLARESPAHFIPYINK